MSLDIHNTCHFVTSSPSPLYKACVSIIANSSSLTHSSSTCGGAGLGAGVWPGVSDLLGGLNVLLTHGVVMVPKGYIGGGEGMRHRESSPLFLFRLFGSSFPDELIGGGRQLLMGVMDPKPLIGC